MELYQTIYQKWSASSIFSELRARVYGPDDIPDIRCFSFIDQPTFEKFIAFCAPLPAGTRVLDLGCGNGDLTARLARQCRAHLTGLDGSAVAINAAQAHASPQLEFVSAYYDTLPFPDQSFDRIIAIDALLAKTGVSWTEIVRVMKPGAPILFSSWFTAEVLEPQPRGNFLDLARQAGLTIDDVTDIDPQLDRQKLMYRHILANQSRVEEELGQAFFLMMMQEAKTHFTPGKQAVHALISAHIG